MAYQSTYRGLTVDERLGVIKTGGLAGQAIIKNSSADYDASWTDPNPDFVTFSPADVSAVPNNTLFVNSADNKLSFKDNTGTVYVVSMA